jgi:hypothetical protein
MCFTIGTFVLPSWSFRTEIKMAMAPHSCRVNGAYQKHQGICQKERNDLCLTVTKLNIVLADLQLTCRL